MTFEELAACSDCLMAIANGDFSGMDDETEARVRAGMARHGWLIAGDSERSAEFSTIPCDVCGDRFHGSRHQVFEESR